MKTNVTYEVCPHCGEEVELKAELMVQTCPNCGKRIVTCSMCRATECDEDYCTRCCLSYQAKAENEDAERDAEVMSTIASKVAQEAVREPEKPVRYRWFAFSDDQAFEDWSDTSFATKKECYEDMRKAVFSKMTWNTEYDEDFNDALPGEEASVWYQVRFAQERIIHSSFSGCYLYRIVEADGKKYTWKDFFNKETIKELQALGLTHMTFRDIPQA